MHKIFASRFLLIVGLAIWAVSGGLLAQGRAPEEVYTGLYIMNVYDLDINEHSFYVDFYIWFKWRGSRDPTNIEFVNAVEKWGFTQIPFYEEPKILPDGHLYNGMRIEGRFYHPFELGDFPLDRHELDIQIENVDYPLDSMVFLPDSGVAFVRPDFLLPGWEIQGGSTENHTSFYPSNFGETGSNANSYSNFTFRLSIVRPLNYFLLKLMLPLLIVLVVSLGALLIHPTNFDARISLPIGGLLTSVFLQQSYSSALPDVGYMVLMDKIYLLAYSLIAAIMLRVIFANNQVNRSDQQQFIHLTQRRDLKLSGLFLLLFLAGLILFIL